MLGQQYKNQRKRLVVKCGSTFKKDEKKPQMWYEDNHVLFINKETEAPRQS